MPFPRKISRLAAGFTLVELMVVLAIIAIITAIAYPAYQDSVRRGRRAAAMTLVAQEMQAQERHRSNHATYSDTALTTTPSGSYYSVSIAADSASPTSYTAQATLVSGTPQSADTRCSTLQAVVSGGSITYKSKNGSGTLNADPDPCWVQ